MTPQPETLFPHDRPDKWKLTISETALTYVLDRWTGGITESEADTENLERFTQMLQTVSTKLLKKNSDKNKAESGPEDRNKLPLDQYDRLKKDGNEVLSKVNAWLGYDDAGKTLRNLCRRFLKMHGFLEQDKKEIPQLQEGPSKASGGDLTKAVAMGTAEQKEFCETEMRKVSDLETRMQTAITEFTTEWLYIAPDMSQAPADPTPTPPPTASQQVNSLGAQKSLNP